MFIEPQVPHHRTGWIEVICGSMFSGKTEELIRRMRRAIFARQSIEIFKPEIDTRYSKDRVVSHNDTSIPSTPVSSAEQILLLTSNVDVVGIDEAQFFDMGLVHVCSELANKGIRVIIAGLDMDYKGKPFGPMPALLATAEFVTKVHAICQVCGSIAHYSYRLNDSEQRVLVGEKDAYEPRCRRCYHEGDKAREGMHQDQNISSADKKPQDLS